MAKRKSPAVYVKRKNRDRCDRGKLCCAPDQDVCIPVSKDGEEEHGTESVCYEEFSRITGIKLKPGEVAKVRITGEKVKTSFGFELKEEP